MSKVSEIKNAAKELSHSVSKLDFQNLPVFTTLEYAWDLHEEYLERFGGSNKKVIFLGMNPGPWGGSNWNSLAKFGCS